MHNAHEEYLDFKPYYESPGPGRELHLRVEVARDSAALLICGASYRDSVKHALLSIDFNQTRPSVSSRTHYRDRNRTELADDCVQIDGVPRGVHVLCLAQREGARPVKLSHLLIL